MFSIEEAKVARPTASVSIPVGASREFGDEAIKRAIEEQTIATQSETDKGIRSALVLAWRKLIGDAPIARQTNQATR